MVHFIPRVSVQQTLSQCVLFLGAILVALLVTAPSTIAAPTVRVLAYCNHSHKGHPVTEKLIVSSVDARYFEVWKQVESLGSGKEPVHTITPFYQSARLSEGDDHLFIYEGNITEYSGTPLIGVGNGDFLSFKSPMDEARKQFCFNLMAKRCNLGDGRSECASNLHY